MVPVQEEADKTNDKSNEKPNGSTITIPKEPQPTHPSNNNLTQNTKTSEEKHDVAAIDITNDGITIYYINYALILVIIY